MFNMINVESILSVSDNSGGELVKCLKLSGRTKKSGKIGDFILISVKTLNSNVTKSKVKEKKIYLACIIRQATALYRFDGSYVSFNLNSVVLLNVSKS